MFGLCKPVSKSKFITLFHTRVVFTKYKSRVTSENTRHPFQVLIQKIATGPTYPAKKNLRKGLTGHNNWTFSWNIDIWNNHLLYKYSSLKSQTLPLCFNYLQNNSLSNAFTKKNSYAQTFSIA